MNRKTQSTEIERGSILMVMLWLVAILGLVATALSFHSRTELRLTSFQWDQACLTQAAQIKAAQAATVIEKSSGPLTLSDLARWSGALFPAKEDSISTVRVDPLTDESSRINLNKASKETLERLTGSRLLAAAILDWRDADNTVSSGGAEMEFYRSLANPYPCRNGPFQSVAELLLVKGMTPELFQEIQSKVTVEGSGTININTVHQDVLEDLGMPTSLAVKILNCRKGPDGIDGTSDDVLFTRKADIPEQLEKRWPLSSSDRASWDTLVSLIDVKGSALRMSVPVNGAESSSQRSCEIVVNPASGTPLIRSWREGVP